MTRTSKRAVYGGTAVLVLALAGWGASVVATGKIEPITKVEIKSKANGIIKLLPVEVDQQVEEGTILVELDRENLMARVREARATLLGARAALQAAEAQWE
jgi:HlyD family secretion protein